MKMKVMMSDLHAKTRFDAEATGNSKMACFALQQEFIRTYLQDFHWINFGNATSLFQFIHIVSRFYTRLISQTLMDSSHFSTTGAYKL